MIPVFLSLHVSVARYKNHEQLPLSSLTDDAQRDELVNELSYLPDGDTANDGGEPSCVESWTFEPCPGSSIPIPTCRDNSRTSCHSSIPQYGSKKCKPAGFQYIAECGDSFPTKCVSA